MSKLAAAAAVAGVGGTGGAGVLAAHSLGAFGGGDGTGRSGAVNSGQVVAQQPGDVSVGTTTSSFKHHHLNIII